MRVTFNLTPIKPIPSPRKPKPPKNISFEAKHPLKSDWIKGKMPSVIHGFYGDILTKENVTLEHLLPRSKGGKSELANFALASGPKNWARGNRPLSEAFDPEAFEQYCKEMRQVHTKNINGPQYVNQLIKTVKRLLRQGL